MQVPTLCCCTATPTTSALNPRICHKLSVLSRNLRKPANISAESATIQPVNHVGKRYVADSNCRIFKSERVVLSHIHLPSPSANFQVPNHYWIDPRYKVRPFHQILSELRIPISRRRAQADLVEAYFGIPRNLDGCLPRIPDSAASCPPCQTPHQPENT